MKSRGFTIVELLIVIVVIAILAAITVVAYNGISQQAQVARAESELNLLAKAIYAARINEDKVLMDITGSNCTNCSDQARYELTLDRIGQAAGMNLAGLKAGNPWGNKYIIDENELENNVCNRDTISAGSGVPSGYTVQAPIIERYRC